MIEERLARKSKAHLHQVKGRHHDPIPAEADRPARCDGGGRDTNNENEARSPLKQIYAEVPSPPKVNLFHK